MGFDQASFDAACGASNRANQIRVDLNEALVELAIVFTEVQCVKEWLAAIGERP